MAWTDPLTRATGFLVTAAVWTSDIVNNLLYLKGRAGTVVIEDTINPVDVLVGGYTITQAGDPGLVVDGSDRAIVAIGAGAALNSSAGYYALLLSNSSAPNSPTNGGVLYVSSADGKLYFKGHNGTVTALASP